MISIKDQCFQADPFIVTVDSKAPQSVFCTPCGSVTTASNSYMSFHVLDEELEGYLQLIKTDVETGKAVKIADTAFSIYRIAENGRADLVEMTDPRNGSATAKTSVFYTDRNGLLKTPEKLPLGRYRVVEVQGPEGYYNDPNYCVEYEITSERVYQVIDNAYDDMDDYIVTEQYFNHETLGQITLRKQGEVLTGYSKAQWSAPQPRVGRLRCDCRDILHLWNFRRKLLQSYRRTDGPLYAEIPCPGSVRADAFWLTSYAHHAGTI